MRSQVNCTKRTGLTLTEVVVSLAIFLFALAAIGQLISMGSERAQIANFRQQAVYLCQSKIAEIAAGAQPLDPQNNVPVESMPDWSWSSICEPDPEIIGLWRVQVTVTRTRALGAPIQVTLSEMILDPSIRGTTMDPPPPEPEATEDPASGTDSSSSGSSGSAIPSGGN